MYKAWGKRTIDIIISFFALIVLSPVIVIIGMSVLLIMGKPVFFKQERPGKDEHVFTMYKFRTMDISNDLKPDEERLTKLGNFLRKTSLDELPEIFNILKGDMSLVGPRPLLIEYLALYSDFQKKRHNVRPGLTGLAQVNGRNAISWEKKFEYDIQYIHSMSFGLDIKILFKTVIKVLKKEDIASQNHVTSDRFEGNTHEK